jgi:hypothetical protein
MTTEHRDLLAHCEACRVCQLGGLCCRAKQLLQDADAADWRPSLAQARAERAVGATG